MGKTPYAALRRFADCRFKASWKMPFDVAAIPHEADNCLLVPSESHKLLMKREPGQNCIKKKAIRTAWSMTSKESFL